MASIEHKALARFLDRLAIAFTVSHLKLANELVSKGIIPQDVLDKVLTVGMDDATKATLIVKSALDQIQVCPKKYHDFMALPSLNDPCHRSLHEEITAVYKSLDAIHKGAQSSRSGSWSGPSSLLTFSRDMRPSKLCEWLLQECGDDYTEDIDKVKAGGINGELFLDLPEDETLLQDLKLCPGFRKLLVKRAKQVIVQLRIISSSTSEASLLLQSYGSESLIEARYGMRMGPTSTLGEDSYMYGIPVVMPTMTEDSLLGRSLQLPGIPVCTTVDSDDEEIADELADYHDGELDRHAQAVWRGRKELGVKFLNGIPKHWMFDGSQLNLANIMSWASEWSLLGEGIIPEFVRVRDPNAESDIRVMFTKGKTQSRIGKKAKRVPDNEPTMWLNLHIEDHFKKYLVVHVFGHALGLGHKHQRCNFWKLLKPYLNEVAMTQRLGVGGGSKKFAKGKSTLHNYESVMHHWFMKDWLKAPYHIRSKVVEDSQPGGPLSQEVAKVLLGVHDRDALAKPLPESPSNKDIRLLKDLYGSGPSLLTFSRDMGPRKLCQWLFQECGDDYFEDIAKVKSGGINGELFLDLPEDNGELLQDLNLSPGFKRLLVKRAKQVKVQLRVPIDVNQSQEAANVLLGVHDRDLTDNPPRQSPSNQDIQLLKDRYGSRRSDSCTVSGPPVIGGGEATHTQDVLSRESHETLYSQLKVHASKWSEMGTHLGFSQAELSNIRACPALYNGAPTSYLRAMLSDWLEWTCDPASPTHKPATLERLKYAVRQAELGRTAADLHL